MPDTSEGVGAARAGVPNRKTFASQRWNASSGCGAPGAGDSFVRDGLYGYSFGFGWPHQVPGFAVLIESRALALRRNAHHFAMFDHHYGENIPSVFREDVSHQEIDFFSGIWNVAGACGPQSVVRPSRTFSPHGFYLNAPKNFSQAHDDIIAIAIAPGLGNGEAEGSGPAHEGEFGEFAAMFAVELGCML